MKRNTKASIIIIVFAVLAGTVLLAWLFHDPVEDFSANVPGLDNRPPKTADTAEVIIGEKFNFYAETETQLQGKWPNFRGASFDNIVTDKTPLIETFSGQPKIAWTVDLGEGHAAPAIYNGKVYILDYNEIKKADALRCFSLETGEELWKRWYNVHVKRNHGMSRTIPAVTDSFVVTIGPKCHVMCTNPANGDFLWGLDLTSQYGTEIPFWNTGQCPLIDNGIAVLAPGGKSLLIGVDCSTGKIVWETPNPDGWKMSHSSVIPITYKGNKMYVYAAIGGICGISAEEGSAGKILWKTTEFSPSVVAPTPVPLPGDKIYITAGYGAGAMLFKLKGNIGNISVEVLQKYGPTEGLASEQQTPVLYEGFLFGILPKDAGGRRNQFVCCSPDDCKNILWTSGKADRYGLGPYIIADGKFFILNDDGTLHIAKANTNGFELLDKASIIEGVDAWGPLAIADGYLLMRDSKKMVCIDIRKNQQ